MTTLTKKIASLFLGDILGKGFSFLATAYLARTLGVEGFGLISIALAYLGYFVFFADFGLHNIGNREVARTSERRDFTPSEIFIARIFMGLMVFVIGWFLLPLIIADERQIEITRLFLLPLIPHAFLLEWFFIGRQRYFTNTVSKTIQNGVYALLVIIFVHGYLELNLVPIFFTTGLILAVIVLIVIAITDVEFKSEIRISAFPDLIRSAASIGSGLFFTQAVLLLPPITIGYFISTAEAGLYGAAYRLIVIGLLVDRLFVPLLLPNLSKQWSENRELAAINMNHTSRIILSIGAALTLFISIGATDFTVWIFGYQYVDSIPIVIILSLFLFITFQNSMFSHGLVAIGKDEQFFKAATIGGFIALVMIMATSFLFNTTMVALSVILGELFIAGLAYFWFRKHISFQYISPFLLTIVMGTAFFFVSGFLAISPWANAIISSLAFLISLRLIKVVRKDDLQWIKSKLVK